MKLILTVDTFKSGEKNGVAWASASGIDAGGRKARAAFRDPREGDGRKRATAMIEQMARAIPEGQDVTDIRPIVECLGSWRDRPLYREGKPIMRGSEPVKERYFEATSFNILSGPALELRRTKQRASEVVDVVSAALQAGDAAKAAEAALEFLRVFSGRPADEIEDVDADEPDAPDAPAGEASPEVATAAALQTPAEAVTEAAPTAEVEAAPTVDLPAVDAVLADTSVPETVEIQAASVDGAVTPVETPETVERKPASSMGASTAGPSDDYESLVAALEAAPPLVLDPAPEASNRSAAQPDVVAAREEPAAAPPMPVAGGRPALPPRPAMGGLQRPGGVVAGRTAVPSAPQSVQPVGRPAGIPQAAPASQLRTPVGERPPAAAHAAPISAVRAPVAPGQSGPARVGPAPGGLRPVSAPRLAPSAAVAPPAATGYRRTEPGEDPEALAAVHIAKASRPGMPQALRPAPNRPGAR